jgi:NAD+ synthase (glutamine-hydrolysing)
MEAVLAAQRQNAELIVLPEMAITGYPPRDILLDTSFVTATAAATQDLARRSAGGPPVLVGSVTPSGRTRPDHPGLYNAAMLLRGSDVSLAGTKRLLPAYDVFHEPRWFLPGPALPPVTIGDKLVGVVICEDLWDEGYEVHPSTDLLNAGADLLIAINASPYRRDILKRRHYHARRQGCPLIYLNLCGATDELIFDGRSFVLDTDGNLLAQLGAFEEEVRTVDVATTTPIDDPSEGIPLEEEVFRALTLGVRDFARKNGVKRLFLGLSGGVDSAVVATIAAEAVGPDAVTALAIPGRYTDPRSTQSAKELAAALGIGFETVNLEPLHAAAEVVLADLLMGKELSDGSRPDAAGTTAENIQARLRALILLAYVNRYGGMLLNTSNKTELSLGYGTLHGDLAGTLCPIGDLIKPEVYALARWIQKTRGLIPPFVLERPPSAELKPDQVDPFDYPRISPVLEHLVQTHRSNTPLRRSEHKRLHMGLILKVSEKAFGTGRLIPITRR